jgi:hypothetical protein
MGWSVIGRGRVLSLLALLVLLAMGGCVSKVKPTSPRDAADLRATIREVYEAVERGDEVEYRKLVGIAPGDAYSDALTATMFESVRLHQAVEAHHLPDREEGGRKGSTRPSTSTRITTSLASVDYRENARAMLKAVEGWTFTVRGDRATIDAVADRPGAPTLRRERGHWALYPTQWDTPRDTATYRLGVQSERDLAAALATARRAVISGEAKSVEAVNEILRNLLTEPPTTLP